MTTATTTRSDEQVQREVLEELKWDARVQPNEVGVAVKDGLVTLAGWVHGPRGRDAHQPGAAGRSATVR